MILTLTLTHFLSSSSSVMLRRHHPAIGCFTRLPTTRDLKSTRYEGIRCRVLVERQCTYILCTTLTKNLHPIKMNLRFARSKEPTKFCFERLQAPDERMHAVSFLFGFHVRNVQSAIECTALCIYVLSSSSSICNGF